jgi:hypothetical protein
MMEGEKDKLLQMESIIHKRLVGQDKAVTVISDAVRRSRAGLSEFIFFTFHHFVYWNSSPTGNNVGDFSFGYFVTQECHFLLETSHCQFSYILNSSIFIEYQIYRYEDFLDCGMLQI